MTGYSRSSVKVEDPYTFLALTVFQETFRTIECYFLNQGSYDEIREGKRSIKWITKMQGTFRVLAPASGMATEEFHQKCIERINDLKRKASKEKYDRPPVDGQTSSGQESRGINPSLV